MDSEMLGLTTFFGIKVPPNERVKIGTSPGADDDSLDTIHLSQVQNLLVPTAVHAIADSYVIGSWRKAG